MTGGTSKGESARKGKGTKAALILCLVVIIVLLAAVAVLLLKNDGSTAEEPKRNVVVNEENAEEVAASLLDEEKTPIGSYEVKMNATWNFEDGAAASDNAYVENVTANTTPVYFDVVRSDTGETVFASPILPVGSHLENITLDEALPAGTYDCVCTYYLLDEEDNPVSQVSVTVKIVVKN